jgi:hypothetical protein
VTVILFTAHTSQAFYFHGFQHFLFVVLMSIADCSASLLMLQSARGIHFTVGSGCSSLAE